MGTFEEVHLGLSKSEAVENAKIFLERERAVKGVSCPLTEDYFSVLKLLAANKIREAAVKLIESNPLPGITSRLAPEFFVETQVFNRKGERISLRAIERFLSEKVHRRSQSFHGTRQLKVAIIGAGLSGLTAAAFLNRLGYVVTILESSSCLGGSLASVYPEFRLPVKTLDKVLNQLSLDGVKFRINVLFPRVSPPEELFDEGGFSAILLASGAGVSEILGIPGENAAGVLSAAKMLALTRAMHAGRKPYTTPSFLGARVVVIGHNEMAFDAARTAVRLGKKVVIVINGSEADIRVSADIVRESADEGVKFKTFSAPIRVLADAMGCVKSLVCRHSDYRVDGEGRLTVVEQDDAEFEIEADTILVARGMQANTLFVSEVSGLDLNLDGSVWVKPDSSYTSVRKIFACGHVVRPGALLLDVMNNARRASMEIHHFLTA